MKQALTFYKKALEQWEIHLLNEELGKFSQKRRLWHEHEDGSFSYLELLRDLAVQHAEIDLFDPRSQFEWPNMTRLMKSTEMEAGLKHELAIRELEKMTKAIKRFVPKSDKKEFIISGLEFLISNPNHEAFHPWIITNPYASEIKTVRHFFEVIHGVSRENNLELLIYPHALNFAGILVLREEMDALLLFKELETIEVKLEEKLVHTEKEKEFMDISRDFYLIEKLLGLMMTKEEYVLYKARKEQGNSQSLRKRFQSFTPAL